MFKKVKKREWKDIADDKWIGVDGCRRVDPSVDIGGGEHEPSGNGVQNG